MHRFGLSWGLLAARSHSPFRLRLLHWVDNCPASIPGFFSSAKSAPPSTFSVLEAVSVGSHSAAISRFVNMVTIIYIDK
jgi:hypothetical protein